MSIHEIDSKILHDQQLEILAISPLPNIIRLRSHLSLALMQLLRHMQSNQKEDLDKSIFHLTKSILLPSLSWLQYGPLIFQALSILVKALLMRLIVSKQPEDAIFAAQYLRHLRDQPHPILGFPRHEVTTLLVIALEFRVNLERSNAVQDIEEMTVLFHELLTDDASEDDITVSSTLLTKAVSSNKSLWSLGQPLAQVIECLRLAKIRKPELRLIHCNLAFCLCARYSMTFVDDDYEEAEAIVDEVIASSSPGDIQDERVAFVQEFVAAVAAFRSMMHRTPEYSEKAMYRIRAAISSDPVGHAFRPWLNFSSEIIAKHRFGYFGSIEGYEAPPSISQPEPVASIADGDKYGAKIDWIFDNLELLNGLVSGIRDNDMTDIDETVGMGRRILASPIPIISPASLLFEAFADLLLKAFRRTRKIEYLDESISTRRQIFGRPSLHIGGIQAIQESFRHLAHPLQWSPADIRTQDLDEALELLSQIPLDYVSYQVELHQLEEAIKTLERGRALLWSEMRHLRTSIGRLQQANPQLAHKFSAINRDLEELTKSIPPSHELSIDDGATDDLRGEDLFGRLLAFDSFLTSPSFDTLRSAASGGPIVIINHSKWRSDILILLQNTPPSLIPTAGDFYDRANTLKDKLLDSRNKYGLDSSHYDQALAFVLAELYELNSPGSGGARHPSSAPFLSTPWVQSHPMTARCTISWISTSAPIPRRLSALIQSRNRDFSSQSSDRPSLLLVAQPDPTIPTVGGEIKVVQSLDAEVTSLLSEAATPATVVDGFRHHQFVHFACHGTLEAGKPFEAGFEFHGGDRLTILDIVRSDLPTAEFAFLSACHTA
ncbi:hypothetical protein H4582DRAFT_2185111 [Lactarius indigo]|nr:hypothetical protein H4582DRAFT_2185111 [Lactarius indigo]